MVRLFSELGFDTGFAREHIENAIFKNVNAGLELQLSRDHYIIKSPNFCDKIPQINMKYILDLVIIPVRNLSGAAGSRINNGIGPGGLWITKNESEQENVLASQLGRLLADVISLDIPYVILDFNRMFTDAEYVYSELSFLLSETSFEDFNIVYEQLCKVTKSNYYTKK